MDVSAILGVVIWPIALIIVFLIFRNEIRALLQKTNSAKLPGGAELSFGNSQVDHPLKDKDRVPNLQSARSVEWTKVGNLYWLGHDLMWTIDVVLRAGGRVEILHGLRQAIHHSTTLGLTSSGARLEALYSEVGRSNDSDLTRDRREKMSLELRRITDQLGAIAENAQPDFRGSVSQNDVHGG